MNYISIRLLQNYYNLCIDDSHIELSDFRNKNTNIAWFIPILKNYSLFMLSLN